MWSPAVSRGRRVWAKALVDLDVALVVLAVERREVDPVVEQGPERGVGEAVVVVVVVRRREVEGRDRQLAAILQPRCPAFRLGDLAAPPEPHPATSPQRIEQRDRQTARPGRILERGDAIGNDHEATMLRERIRAAHALSSHVSLRRVAALMMPTSE